MEQTGERRILVTGATGSVGTAVHPALAAAGWQVRCLSRDARAARRRRPHLEWVERFRRPAVARAPG